VCKEKIGEWGRESTERIGKFGGWRKIFGGWGKITMFLN
jgi:hypothetical protein